MVGIWNLISQPEILWKIKINWKRKKNRPVSSRFIKENFYRFHSVPFSAKIIIYVLRPPYPPIHKKKNPRQDLIRGETLMKKKTANTYVFFMCERKWYLRSLFLVYVEKKISFLITLIDFFFGTAIRTRLIRYTVHNKRRFFFLLYP